MKKLSILFLCAILFSLSSCTEDYPELEDGIYAEIITNQGPIVAKLYYQATPMTVASFVSLAEGKSTLADSTYRKDNKGFYDGLIFHRVIKDFMIQGGDPTGTGSGGPGYNFPDEIVDSLQFDSKGLLAMANSGPNTNGSQFFITLKETPWLNGLHTIFGEVVIGQDVVDAIGQVETATGDKPVEDVVMKEVNIIKKGNKAEDFNAPEVLDQKIGEAEAAAKEAEKKKAEQMAVVSKKYEELKPEATELESGLQMYYLEEGEGKKPEVGETVLIYYKGYLPSGELFDTNVEALATKMGVFDPRRKDMGGYEPMPTKFSPESRMIPGFTEGIMEMNVGDKAILYIPAHLGYGKRGRLPVIQPNADLIFEVEMVGIQGPVSSSSDQ